MGAVRKVCRCEPVTDVTGVAVPRLDGNSLVLRPRCLKIRGIATPACALVRNDRAFSNSPFSAFSIILHPKPEIKLKIPLPVWQGEKCMSQSSFSARSAYWDSRGFFLEASFMEASTPLVASLMGRMVPAPAMQPPGQAMPSRR